MSSESVSQRSCFHQTATWVGSHTSIACTVYTVAIITIVAILVFTKSDLSANAKIAIGVCAGIVPLPFLFYAIRITQAKKTQISNLKQKEDYIDLIGRDYFSQINLGNGESFSLSVMFENKKYLMQVCPRDDVSGMRLVINGTFSTAFANRSAVPSEVASFEEKMLNIFGQTKVNAKSLSIDLTGNGVPDSRKNNAIKVLRNLLNGDAYEGLKLIQTS